MWENIKYYFNKWRWILTDNEGMPPPPPVPPKPLPIHPGIQYDHIEEDMKLFKNVGYDCLYKYRTEEHCAQYHTVREEFNEIHGRTPEEARGMGY